MSPEQVVVSNQGMAGYLNLVVARENKICANLRQLRLWDLIWKTLRQVFPTAGTVNRFSHEHLTWSLFSLKEMWASSRLPPEDACLQVLKEYVLGDEDDTKAFELCSRIADTFDQYQMYRHEWITQWNELTGEDFALYAVNPEAEGKIKRFIKHVSTREDDQDPFITETFRTNLWQLRLWSLLKDNLDAETFETGEDPRFASLDRASCIYKLCAELDNPTVTIEGLPERIFVFGLSTMSPLELLFLQTLSKRVEIYYMLLNPCCDYWGDLTSHWQHEFAAFRDLSRRYSRKRVLSQAAGDTRQLNLESPTPAETTFEPDLNDYDDKTLERVEGHPLLLSLGREEMELLARLIADEEGTDFLDAFLAPECDSMLHEVQRSLLYAFKDTEQRRRPPLIDPQDDSLVIHSCHTIRRQLEVLKDALLRRFARDKGRLRLRDCVVMVPDIEEFAPFIHAVFGELKSSDPRYLPYLISDRSEANESTVAQAVLQLLSLSQKRVTASLVGELLTVPALAAKFSFSSEEVEVICRWCQEVRLYWGLDDAEVSRQLGSSGTEVQLPWTFERALLRMLEGYMLGEAEHRSDLYTEIEGVDADLLGRFYSLVQKLIRLRDLFSPSLNANLEGQRELWPTHEAQSWMRIIEEQVIGEFFLQNEETEEELLQLREVVDAMQNAIYNLRLKPQITLPVFAALLKRRLGKQAVRQPHLGDFINFCSLVPMRAVPFKHVFILGLNEGVFPRQDQDPAFNLAALPALRCKGDRSRASDDRLLFLEALLSAEESLELFYNGQSPETQQTLVPSVVLSELVDFCCDFFRLAAVPEGQEQTAGSGEQVAARLIRQESMTAWHEDNYQPGGAWQSFDAAHVPVRNSGEPKAPPRLADRLDYSDRLELPAEFCFDVSALTEALTEPCRIFLEQSLGVKLQLDYATTFPSDEPFALDGLAFGQLLTELFAEGLKNSEQGAGQSIVSELMERYAQGGRLPYGELGAAEQQRLAGCLEAMLSTARRIAAPDPAVLSYEAESEAGGAGRQFGCRFIGQIASPYLYPQCYTDNVKNPRLAVRLLLSSLALSFAGASSSCAHAVMLDGRLVYADVTRHPELKPSEILRLCCQRYVRARLGPLPFNHRLWQQKPQEDPLKLLAVFEDLRQQDESLSYVFCGGVRTEGEAVLALLREAQDFFSRVISPCIVTE